MGLQFRFLNTGATVKHLNFRKQGPDDEKILAVDLKLGGEVVFGPWLAELFTADVDDYSFPFDIENLLWRPNEVFKDGGETDIEHNTRFYGITDPIRFDRSFEQCQVTFGGLDLIGRAGKFAFVPGAKKICDVTFSLAIMDPDQKTVSILSEMLSEDAQCEVYAPDLLDDEPQEPDAAEEQQALDMAASDGSV